jgi:hypothetical protein
MEYVEGQQADVAVRNRLYRLNGCPGNKRKAGFRRKVNGMQKAETGHRSAGESRLHGLGGVFTVEHTGIAEEMDLNEQEEDEQTQADADPGEHLSGHWRNEVSILSSFRQQSHSSGWSRFRSHIFFGFGP